MIDIPNLEKLSYRKAADRTLFINTVGRKLARVMLRQNHPELVRPIYRFAQTFTQHGLFGIKNRANPGKRYPEKSLALQDSVYEQLKAAFGEKAASMIFTSVQVADMETFRQ